MITLGYNVEKHFGASYFVLDRYFLTIPVLTLLNTLNNRDHILDIITRPKRTAGHLRSMIQTKKINYYFFEVDIRKLYPT